MSLFVEYLEVVRPDFFEEVDTDPAVWITTGACGKAPTT